MLFDLIKTMGFNAVNFFVDTKEDTKDDRALFFLESPDAVFANKALLNKLGIKTPEEITAFLNGMIASLIPFAMNRIDARQIIETEFMSTLYNLLSD